MLSATFTPLVMSATGGMGRAATTFFKRLANMISEKGNTEDGSIVKLSTEFHGKLSRASIVSIRGARSSRHYTASETTQGPIDLQLSEGQIH